MSQIITNLTSLPTMHTGVSGRFRAIVRDLMGRPVYDTGWIDNLVTDLGLELLGETNWYSKLYIGSNGAASTVGMTAMQTYIAQQTPINWNGNTGAGVIPNYEHIKTTYGRWPAGTGPETIREFGIGQSADDTGTLLVARQVVTPAIVITADNILDLWYEWTNWPELGDKTANGVLIGTETYDTITREANLDSWGCYPFRGYGLCNPTYYYLYEGTIGTNLEVPSGSGDNAGSGLSYGAKTQNGSVWYRDSTLFTDINSANFPTGVGACQFRRGNETIFQTSFNADGNGTLPLGANIPKDDTYEIDLTYRLTWGRKV